MWDKTETSLELSDEPSKTCYRNKAELTGGVNPHSSNHLQYHSRTGVTITQIS